MPTHALTPTAPLYTLALILRRLAFSPTLTFTLHLLLTRVPSARTRLLTLFPSLHRTRNFTALLTTLKILCGVGAVSTLNGALNGFARRQWCWREQGEKWDFSGPRAGGEVVVVTGGCGGFGRGIVKGLMGRCRVVVLDVQELPEEFEGRAGLYYYRCDLTSPASIAETAAAIRRDAGDPTVLINNAGLVSKLPILETSREDLERLFRVNLFSHWALIQEFLPAMLEKRKGHVVSVASMASYLSGPCMGDYSATKAGVLALHEALTAELRSLYTPNGTCIRTTIVHPMWAATPMLRDWQPMLEARGTPILDPSEIYDRIVAQVLSGKSAQIYVPAEVGRYSGLRGWPTWLQEWIRTREVGKDRPGKASAARIQGGLSGGKVDLGEL